MANLTIYADGLCEPCNPGGYACYGWVAIDGATEVASGKGCVGHGAGMTNNLAEYTAAIKALEWAVAGKNGGGVLRTDSQLVARQFGGQWRCNDDRLRVLLARLRELAERAGCGVEWVPRENNRRADALSRQAYAEARRAALGAGMG